MLTADPGSFVICGFFKQRDEISGGLCLISVALISLRKTGPVKYSGILSWALRGNYFLDIVCENLEKCGGVSFIVWCVPNRKSYLMRWKQRLFTEQAGAISLRGNGPITPSRNLLALQSIRRLPEKIPEPQLVYVSETK